MQIRQNAQYVLFALLLTVATPPAQAQTTCREVMSPPSPVEILRIQKPEERILEFLQAVQPDYQKVRDSIRFLDSLDLQRPEYASYASKISPQIRQEAADLIQIPLPKEATQQQIQNRNDKIRLLNTPVLRNLLTETQQQQVGLLFWAINHPLRDQTLSLEAKRKQIQERIKTALTPLIAGDTPKLFLPTDYVRIVEKGLEEVEAEALITSIECRGFCSSQIHELIRGDLPEGLKNKELKDGLAISIPHAETSGNMKKNMILVVDEQRLPLSNIVFNALMAAEKAGYPSAVLPALRTGYAFGAIESTQSQVTLELLQGIARYVNHGNGVIKKIDIAVPKNRTLVRLFEKWISESKPNLDRSLRHNLRPVSLSGQGFVLTPNKDGYTKPLVDSPIYKTLHSPWDLSHMMEIYAPLELGQLKNKTVLASYLPSVLNMPIQLPGTQVKVPLELLPLSEFLQTIFDHEARINPRYKECYVYLTVDQGPVMGGKTHRQPGIHIDGVQGRRYPVKLPPEHSYSISDTLGTIFYPQVFDLRGIDANKDNVHNAIYDRRDPSKAITTKDFEIYFWNSYSAHESQISPRPIPQRVFIRVEFSYKVYDNHGDTKSPLFDYDWQRVYRPIPSDLDVK